MATPTPSSPEKGALSSFLEERGIDDIGHLAVLSGVGATALQKVDERRATLAPQHVKAVLEVVPDIPKELLQAPPMAEPKLVRTERGEVPEGTTLLFVRAQELQVGDYINYLPRKVGNGLFWARVEELLNPTQFIHVLLEGGARITLPYIKPVKVARSR